MGRGRGRLTILLVLALLVASLHASAELVQAATTVTNCTEANLRTAVAAGGVVYLNCTAATSTIQLTGTQLTGTLTFDVAVTLDASGAAQPVTIKGGGPGSNFTVVRVNPRGAATLKALTISNGHSTSRSAAGIEVLSNNSEFGALTLTNSTVSNNTTLEVRPKRA